jgi:integrase
MAKRTNTAVWMENQNRWQINVQKDGIRRSFTSSTPGRTGQREANAKADAWLDDNITNANEKISKIFEIYIAECKTVYSQGMYSGLESRFKTWAIPVIGNVKMSALTEQHIQRIINNAYAAGRSRKTLMNIRADLYAFVKYCRKCKYTTLFPENITIPKDADFKEKHILLPEDLQKLFTCDKTQLRGQEVFEELIYAFRFHVLTGLRPGELLGLEWRDIDWKTNTVHIQRSINKYQETTKGKNKTANRLFGLSDIAAEVLREQQKLNAFGRVFGDITPIYYTKHWHKFCEYNGISRVTPYELRHTFVSVSAEMPEGMLQKLVGHTKSMDSFGTYGHTYSEMRRKTAEKSNEIWSKVLKLDNE